MTRTYFGLTLGLCHLYPLVKLTTKLNDPLVMKNYLKNQTNGRVKVFGTHLYGLEQTVCGKPQEAPGSFKSCIKTFLKQSWLQSQRHSQQVRTDCS